MHTKTTPLYGVIQAMTSATFEKHCQQIEHQDMRASQRGFNPLRMLRARR